jgi:hypothetical protein
VVCALLRTQSNGRCILYIHVQEMFFNNLAVIITKDNALLECETRLTREGHFNVLGYGHISSVFGLSVFRIRQFTDGETTPEQKWSRSDTLVRRVLTAPDEFKWFYFFRPYVAVLTRHPAGSEFR